MRTADFNYSLPPDLIAQHPAAERDQSRLLVLRRTSGSVSHQTFRSLPEFLAPGDILVFNNSRVIPARLRGMNPKTHGMFELLLLEENGPNDWWALVRPGKKARIGTRVLIDRSAESIEAEVVAINDAGHRRFRFHGTDDIGKELERIGEVPLPPYIQRAIPGQSTEDLDRYQTVFGRIAGSVAAPTAGLHFTAQLLDACHRRGVETCFVTLHVGLGTFAPVKTASVAQHVMHEERFEIDELAAGAIRQARDRGGRVVAVGTTTVRVVETVARDHGEIIALRGRTRIFIHPPYDFKVVEGLLTNFHLPRSTLLMLASAFASPGKLDGREKVLAAYAEAIRERYRFFSYGDAMLIM